MLLIFAFGKLEKSVFSVYMGFDRKISQNVAKQATRLVTNNLPSFFLLRINIAKNNFCVSKHDVHGVNWTIASLWTICFNKISDEAGGYLVPYSQSLWIFPQLSNQMAYPPSFPETFWIWIYLNKVFCFLFKMLNAVIYAALFKLNICICVVICSNKLSS